jgi:formylglycine-generating enzyme
MSCCFPSTKNSRSLRQELLLSLISEPRRLDIGRMAAIPPGVWRLGYEGPEAYPEDGEGPEREAHCDGFLIDRTAVTNAEFADFIAATGYVTDADRIGWSFVFFAQLHPAASEHVLSLSTGSPQWWLPVRGANWSAPDGPGSDILSRHDHPVVHVSWTDAVTFAHWVGKRLPSEIEWEISARGGLLDAIYPWGNDLRAGRKHNCNIWQGQFPFENTGEDGFLSTAPVSSYAANGFGLFNMVGNVWEWTADNWSADQSRLKSMRGGSYLCHRSYCNRYRVTARTFNAKNASSSNLGFRCAAHDEAAHRLAT